MAPVPAWTREWRPLVTQLCALFSDPQPSHAEAPRLVPREALLLRVDRVVGLLYAHKFVDTLPRDVAHQTEALATKFRVHSLEDRAEKLLQLSQHCDDQVLKLLLELATSPTTARDEDAQVDEDSESRWKTVLQQEQLRQKQHKQLQDQLVEELFQIATNDEWYQAWDESDEESDWERSNNEDTAVERERSIGTRQRKRTSEDLESDGLREQTTVLQDRVSLQQVDKGREFSEDEQLRDEVLCRYHPEVLIQGEDEVDDTDDPTCVMESRELVPFTLDRPWLLCQAVAKSAEGPALSGIVPRRLIHEQSVVSMVFEALDGIESLLFEFRPAQPTPSIFSLDFTTMAVDRSRRSLGVAIGHLSPLALHHILSQFAGVASELQLLRDFIAFVRQARNLSEQHRCVTLEGLANALSEVIENISDSIRKVELQINSAVNLEGKDAIPWSGIASRQPTLLGIYGGLKESFQLISWLKRAMVTCFQTLSGRHWHEVKRAEQAKCVLDALYRMMELEYVEGVSVDSCSAVHLSRSNILLHLFIGALNPYLSLINRMIFERGHFETIPLDGELFFATPASLSISASPMRERNQSFRDGLLGLAPFEVNRSLVPVILESMINLMNEALASRQMKNRFLQQQQHKMEESTPTPEPLQPSLSELLARELEALGCRRIRRILSIAAPLTQDQPDARSSSQQVMLECIPFNRILERCLTQHVESKCQQLNSEISDIFRDRLCYMDHVNALRMFVLMGQQDVFNTFSDKMVAHMQLNPVAWADSEKLNSFYQSAIQGVFEDNSLSSSQRQIGGRLCVRVDFSLLDGASSSTKVDIATLKCMYFTLATQQPLRVLFSTSIMQKYSRLGVFLVQVKAVESALVKFKSTLRHRRCYAFVDGDLRPLLIQIADMLHYTKSLLSYLTSQVSSEGWSKYRHILQSSRNLHELDDTHEQYLDYLLNRFFLLDKHATVIQYILTTFNHILRFVGQVDEFISAVDRNMLKYFPESSKTSDEGSNPTVDQDTEKLVSTRLLESPDFHILHAEMTRSAKEFKRQSHFLVVMLTAMQKHGTSPHVNEIVTQLNYNYFYYQQERRSRAQVPLQQNQPTTQAKHAPSFNRSGSLHPPPAPKPFSRARSVHLP